MEFFKNSRQKIGNAILKKRASRSQRKMLYTNFRNVKNIGIVWDASKEEEFQPLARFHQKMLEKNIEVSIIGFYNNKNLPDKYTALRYFNCLKISDINLFYIPQSSESQKFVESKFDVLIDINSEKLLTLTYLTTLSKASFKVGLLDTDTENSPYDLMMEIRKPVNAEEYLKQTLQYLEMINS
jgi:hypothetical protein